MQWLSWASPAFSCQETALHLAFQAEPHSNLAISITAWTSTALQNPLCCSSRSRAYIEAALQRLAAQRAGSPGNLTSCCA